jgi:hypothetical protein
MFSKIADALKKSDSGNGGGSFANVMKFPAGNTYTIRLIPNVDDVDATFFHHVVHGWKSNATGAYTSALSLQTFKERDPIAELRWKLYNEWKTANPTPGVDSKGKAITFQGPIKQDDQWYVNALWVDNPANPELNGQVKVFKMGPQLKKIVDDAMTGERSDEFGAAIFDLSKDGADFRIVAEKQGEYTTFIKSYFKSKSKLDLDDDEIEKIYESVHDLTQIQPVKTVDELNTLLDDHFFCGSVKTEVKKPLSGVKSKPVSKEVPWEDGDDDEIPMEFEEPEKVVKTTKSPKKNTSVDDEVDELLADLDLD